MGTRLRGKFGNIFDKLLDSSAVLTGVIMMFVMSNIIVSVITRYFFNRPLIWVTEIDEYMMVYVTFLGTAWLLREDGHVKVDIIYKFVGIRIRFFLELISDFVGIVVSSILILNGLSITLDHFKKGIYNPTLLEIPLWMILIIIPVGSILLLIQFIRRTCRHINYHSVEIREPPPSRKDFNE